MRQRKGTPMPGVPFAVWLFQGVGERLPRAGGDGEDGPRLILGVADVDGARGVGDFHAVAVAAGVSGSTPARLVRSPCRPPLISAMSCRESLGDRAHPLIMLSAVAMSATSLGSSMTCPDSHPSR